MYVYRFVGNKVYICPWSVPGCAFLRLYWILVASRSAESR